VEVPGGLQDRGPYRSHVRRRPHGTEPQTAREILRRCVPGDPVPKLASLDHRCARQRRGADELGKKLLSYLLDKPFQYYDDLVINKREFDLFRYAANARPIPAESVEKRADGKYHNVSHPNWGIQQPLQPHFGGRVLAIMNGGSFSTTCEFLSNLHYRKRATFLGEEAAGGYYGNTSGRSALVTLPNTNVRVVIPLETYYLAVKGAPNPSRSILPDVEVKPAIQDLLSGNDRAMAKAIELAHGQ
jgi:hypothetical protein